MWIISTLFIGPVPFLPIETKLYIIQIATGFAGLGNALLVVSTFSRSQRAALDLGYADDINTYIAISGTLVFKKLKREFICFN